MTCKAIANGRQHRLKRQLRFWTTVLILSGVILSPTLSIAEEAETNKTAPDVVMDSTTKAMLSRLSVLGNRLLPITADTTQGGLARTTVSSPSSISTSSKTISGLGGNYPGANGSILASAEYNGRLVIGGDFTAIAGDSLNHIAMLVDSQWVPIGGGVVDKSVTSIASYNGRLIVAEREVIPGGWFYPTTYVYQTKEWDGNAWSSMPHSLGVSDIMVYNDTLYGEADNASVVYWDDTSWVDLGHLPNPYVGSSKVYLRSTIKVFQGAITVLTIADDTSLVLRSWMDGSWVVVGGTLSRSEEPVSIAFVNDKLYASTGYYSGSRHILLWNDSTWSTIGVFSDSRGSAVLTEYGGKLFVAGDFGYVNGQQANGLAIWDGGAWAIPGPRTDGSLVRDRRAGGKFYSFGEYQGQLVLVSRFVTLDEKVGSEITLWDGSQFQGVTTLQSQNAFGLSSNQSDLAFIADMVQLNGDVVVAGRFDFAGSQLVNNISRFDGTKWNSMGSGLNGDVHNLAVYGGKLFATGEFNMSGNDSVSLLAAFYNGKWHQAQLPFPPNMISSSAGILYADPSLLVYGFSGLGSENRLFSWDGKVWTSMDDIWSVGGVSSMVQYHGQLVASGAFTKYGDYYEHSDLLKWDGVAWEPIAIRGFDHETQGGLATIFNGELALEILPSYFNYRSDEISLEILDSSNGKWTVLGHMSSKFDVMGEASNGLLVTPSERGWISGAQISSSLACWNGKEWGGLNGFASRHPACLLKTDTAVWVGMYDGGVEVLGARPNCLPVAAPDLSIDSLVVVEDVQGSYVKCLVHNIGDSVSFDYSLSFRISQDSTLFGDEFSSLRATPLASGEKTWLIGPVVPATYGPQVWLTATVLPADVHGNRLFYTDRTDANNSLRVPYSIGAPELTDLFIDTLLTPKQISLDSIFTIGIVVSYGSAESANLVLDIESAGATLKSYTYSLTTPNGSGVLDTLWRYVSLGAHQLNLYQAEAVPQRVTFRTHLDSDNTITESNEENNIAVSSADLIYPPFADLAITELIVPDSILTTDTTRLQVVVANLSDIPITGQLNYKIGLINSNYRYTGYIPVDMHFESFSPRPTIALAPKQFDTLEVFVSQGFDDQWNSVANNPWLVVKVYSPGLDFNNKNNTRYSNKQIRISVPGDVIVREVLAPDAANRASSLQVRYVIENTGIFAASKKFSSSLKSFPESFGDLVTFYFRDSLAGGEIDTITVESEILPRNAPDVIWVSSSGVTSKPIFVHDPPLPDLVIDTVIVPDSLIRGDSLRVRLNITNIGDTTAYGSVRGSVYFANHACRPYGWFGAVYYYSDFDSIAVGEGQVAEVNIFMPDYVGCDSTLVVATIDGRMWEKSLDNNTDTSRSYVHSVYPKDAPDLIVSELHVPDTMFYYPDGKIASASGDIEWIATNLSDSFPAGGRVDGLAINVTNDLDHLVGRMIARSDSLVAGSPDTVRLSLDSLTLTSFYYSPFPDSVWIGVEANVAHYGQENRNVQESDLTNNFLLASTPTYFVSAPLGDLEVVDVSWPDFGSIRSGDSVTLTWKVTNTGDATIIGPRDDFVYLSDTSAVVSSWSSHIVASSLISVTDSINAGDTTAYELTMFISQSVASGNYWFGVTTDYYSNIFEKNNSNNSLTATVPVIIIAADAGKSGDLQVVSVTFPGTAMRDSDIDVQWRVTNIGDTAVAGTWVDRITLSGTNEINSPIQTDSDITRTDTLIVGDTATYHATIHIPKDFPDMAWVTIREDVGYVFPESNKENNLMFPAAHIVVRSPSLIDLKPVSITMPDSAARGNSLEISWVVENIGDSTAVSAWDDGVFLSPIAQLFEATPSVRYSHIDTLMPGESDTLTGKVFIPEDAPDHYWIIVKSDVANAILETDESNNVLVSLDSLPLYVPRHPDLVVSELTAPVAVETAESFDIVWTITNLDSAVTAQGPWVESLFVAPESLRTEDSLAATFVFTGSLLPGESYQHIHATTFSKGTIGTYRFKLTTDATNNVLEYAENSNNSAMATNATIVTESPHPNLVVSDVKSEASGVSGGATVVEWTVSDSGTAPTAVPRWFDYVYLSADQQLDESDSLIGKAENLTYLDVVESYKQSVEVTLPWDLSGSYYLIVKTDGGGQVFEGAGDADNALASANTIEVTFVAQPRADLSVVMNSVATSGWAGDSINVAWTVTNIGDKTAVSGHTLDLVRLSSDSTFSDDDQIVGKVDFSYTEFSLDPDSSYSEGLNVRLPDNLLDTTYYIYVRTNTSFHFGETNLANNRTELYPVNVSARPPADLEVTATSIAKDSLLSGDSVSVNYLVNNNGPMNTLDIPWGDNVFLMNVDPSSSIDSVLLGSVDHSGVLAVDQSYIAVKRFRIPVTTPSGFYEIMVCADSKFQIDEGAFNDNNCYTSDSFYVSYAPPDLSVTNIAVQGQAASGRPLTIEWSVSNVGSGKTTVNRWQDEIYISHDSTFQPHIDSHIGGFERRGPLNPGDTYTDASDHFTSDIPRVIIPNSFEGEGYLLVIADRKGEVFEGGLEENNIAKLAVDVIATPSADLRPQDVDIPILGSAGSHVAIKWSVENDGSGESYATEWFDRIYLSRDTLLDIESDSLIGQLRHSGNLQSNAKYMQDSRITIPDVPNGHYFVLLSIDDNNKVYERDSESNNVYVAPISVEQNISSLPNLHMDSIAIIKEVFAGKQVTVDWYITNNSLNPIPNTTPRWKDGIYLSSDAILDVMGDSLLRSSIVSEHLLPDSTYHMVSTVTIPPYLEGTYNLFVVSDVSDALQENNEADNVGAGELSITRASADLTPAQPSFPLVVVSGQGFDVSCNITNTGIGQTNKSSWVDAVYLSRDLILDETDRLLGYANRSAGLDPDSTYYFSIHGSVPLWLTGEYHVLVRADLRNDVYEQGRKDNNLSVSSEMIRVDMAAPVDLVVDSVFAPESMIAGDSVAISWVISNIAPNPATGGWSDAIYLSSDISWDIDDKLISTATHTSSLSSGVAYRTTRQVSVADLFDLTDANVPGVTPGEYFVIVRTDIRNNLRETNDKNNVGVTNATSHIDVPTLSVGVPITGVLHNHQALYWKIDTSESMSAHVRLSLADKTAGAGLYFQNGVMPDRVTHEVSGNLASASSQTINIYLDGAGGAYIMVYGQNIPGDTTRITLLVENAPFALTEASPMTVGNAGRVTLELKGAQLSYLDTAMLISMAQDTIVASSMTWYDDFRTLATFDLKGVSSGDYKLQLFRSGITANIDYYSDSTQDIYVSKTEKVTLPFPIGVVAALSATNEDCEIETSYPSVVRSGDAFNVTIQYKNSALNDIRSPLMTLSFNKDVRIASSYSGPFVATSFSFLGLGEDGLANWLRPGQSGKITFSIEPRDFGSTEFQVNVLDDQSSEVPDLESYIPDVDIDPAILKTMNTKYGGTWSNYQRGLGDLASKLTKHGARQPLLSFLFPVAYRAAILEAGDILSSDQSNGNIYPSANRTFRRPYCPYTGRFGNCMSTTVGVDIGSDGCLREFECHEWLRGYSTFGGDDEFKLYDAYFGGGVGEMSGDNSGNLLYFDEDTKLGLKAKTLNSHPRFSMPTAFEVAKTVGKAAIEGKFEVPLVLASLLKGPIKRFLWEPYSSNPPQLVNDKWARAELAASIPIYLYKHNLEPKPKQNLTFDLLKEGFDESDLYGVLGKKKNLAMKNRGALQGFTGTLLDNTIPFMDYDGSILNKLRLVFKNPILVKCGSNEKLKRGVWLDYTVSYKVTHSWRIANWQPPFDWGLYSFFGAAKSNEELSNWQRNFADGLRTLEEKHYASPVPVQLELSFTGQIEGSIFLIDEDKDDPSMICECTANCGNDGEGPAGPTNTTTTKGEVRTITSLDPNEKIGPAGIDGANGVTVGQTLPYSISFENVSTALAAAREVTITDHLDSDLDLRRFRLGDIAFGDTVITPPANAVFFHSLVDYDTSSLMVEINAGLDYSTGIVSWTFRTFDSLTGQAPKDPFAGFLPPNDSEGSGEGHVSYTVKANVGLAQGTELRNTALIVFDDNEPIVTNEVVNVIITDKPDLLITHAGFSSASSGNEIGQPFEMDVSVANDGGMTSSSFKIGLYVGHPDSGGVIVDEMLVNPLSVGQERNARLSWTPLWPSDTTQLYIIADVENKVAERDETNNLRDATIQVVVGSAIAGNVSDTAGVSLRDATIQVYDTYPTGSVLENVNGGDSSMFILDGRAFPTDVDIYIYQDGYYPTLLQGIHPGTSGLMVKLTPVSAVVQTSEWVDYYCDSSVYQDAPLPVGAVVEAVVPGNRVVGRVFVTLPGKFGPLHVYRASSDSSSDGVHSGSILTFRINQNEALNSRVVSYPNSSSIPIEVCLGLSFVAEQTMSYPTGWNLVSTAIVPVNPELSAVFGDDIQSWKVSEWNCGAYRNSIEINGCGLGYWLHLDDGGTIDYQGSACTTSENVVCRELCSGWNLIGSPFLTGVDWPATEIDSSGLRINMAAAIQRGWVSAALYGYDPSSQAYYDAIRIRSGKAYWFAALVDGLEICLSSNSSGANNTSATVSSDSLLRLRDMLIVGSVTEQGEVYVGVSSAAEDGFDPDFDLPMAPPIPDQKTARIRIGSDYGQGFAGYRQDVRKPSDTVVWTLILPDESSNQIYIHNLEALTGNGYSVRAIMDNEHETPPISQDTSLEVLGRSFKIVAYKTSSLKPDHFYVNQNYPNPFNPSTQIEFGLPVASDVEITIYNILGQTVKTVTHQMYDAGDYRLTWEGRNKTGERVASGVYFYRIKAGEFKQTKKMVMLK